MNPIIDAHHHIWRLDRTPWLQGPRVPRIFGDYGPLRRDYTIDEFAADVLPHSVVQSVHVQANVAPADAVWEVDWAANEGRRRNLAGAIVAFADLRAPDVGDVLDRQLATGPVRGLRQQLHWHSDPRFSFAAEPDEFLKHDWQRGLREAGRRGLHFELQVFPNQYEAAISLVASYPDIRFILLHAGMPVDRTPEGMGFWAAGLRRFAELPNVWLKVSALGTFIRRCTIEDWRPVVVASLDAFGPDRCLFGSNFPIEKLWTDYSKLIGTFMDCLTELSPAERHAVLFETAERLYGLSKLEVQTRSVCGRGAEIDVRGAQ